jgi:hypothetical protein
MSKDSNTVWFCLGRFRHFAWMSNPLNGLVPSTQLEQAKALVIQYKEGREPPATTPEEVCTGTDKFVSGRILHTTVIIDLLYLK